MGSPANARDRFFSTWDWSGLHLRWEITSRFDPADTTILDVGAGWGKTREVLPEYVMDAVEVWRPYITGERLADRYRHVFEGDIADVPIGEYDAAVLGDVFEHLTVRKARLVLGRLLERCGEVYVVVPFTYEQPMVNGNPFEIHQQADLTRDVMAERYPELQALAVENGKGLYVRDPGYVPPEPEVCE